MCALSGIYTRLSRLISQNDTMFFWHHIIFHLLLDQMLFYMVRQLMYQHFVCLNTWNELSWTKGRNLRHYVQHHLGHWEDWIFSVSLVTCTCNVWRNMLSCICQDVISNIALIPQFVAVLPTQGTLKLVRLAASGHCTWTFSLTFSSRNRDFIWICKNNNNTII